MAGAELLQEALGHGFAKGDVIKATDGKRRGAVGVLTGEQRTNRKGKEQFEVLWTGEDSDLEWSKDSQSIASKVRRSCKFSWGFGGAVLSSNISMVVLLDEEGWYLPSKFEKIGHTEV